MNNIIVERSEGALAPSYLRLEGVSKSYGNVKVVNTIDLVAPASKFVCVLGPSGCGKTTLLRLIAGFETTDSGKIIQAGKDVTALPPESRDYGIVFQSYALFPNRTVAGNVAFGLEATGVHRNIRTRRVSELLSLVGLVDHAHKYPNQISGGQQQRVALARALALSPGLLLLDEPLSALDANVRAHLRGELKALQQRIGVTALMVTHDREEAFSVADHIVIMNKGNIEQTGSPEDIYQNPANLFVARLLGGCNALVLDSLEKDVAVVQGLKLQVDARQKQRSPNARLCIRPGAVLVGAEADGSENAFTARLQSLMFLGDIIRLHLAPDQSPSVVIEAEVLRSRLHRMPSPGDAIRFALPEKHLMLLGSST